MQVIEPKSIYFNPRLIFHHLELWRLLTNFCFFGSLGEPLPALPVLRLPARNVTELSSVQWRAGLDFLFHMFFLIKYSKSLEEGSFRGKSADFFWMLAFGKLLLSSILWFGLAMKMNAKVNCLAS